MKLAVKVDDVLIKQLIGFVEKKKKKVQFLPCSGVMIQTLQWVGALEQQ